MCASRTRAVPATPCLSRACSGRTLQDCHFALPRIALAAAGCGCDAIAIRQLNRAWHLALLKQLRNGLLESVRVQLNIEALAAELASGCLWDDDEKGTEDGVEEDGFGSAFECAARPRSEMTLMSPSAGGEIICVCFSPCGAAVTLVTVRRAIPTFDLATGKLLFTLCGHDGVVTALSYSHCGRRLLTASLDGTARTWDAETGAQVLVLSSTSGALYDADYSPCGHRILTTSFGGAAVIWDASTGDEVHQLIGHSGVVFSGMFSADGETILTVSKDGSAQVWYAETGRSLEVLGIEGTKIRNATFSPISSLVVLGATESGRLIHWRWIEASSCWLQTLLSDRNIATAVFSPCAHRVIACTRDYKVWLFTLCDGGASEEFLLMESETYEVQSAGFSPCGRLVATASGGITGTVRLWDAESLVERCAYEVSPGAISGVNRMAFSPCGSRLLVATYNGTVRCWGRGPIF